MGNHPSLFYLCWDYGIWLYTSSDVKKDVDQEGVGVLDDMTIPAVD